MRKSPVTRVLLLLLATAIALGGYANGTGEPLSSSTDKYESSCGWPAFTKPIEEPSIVEIEDNSHGMQRVEVRSRVGNSHLGHVFENDPESPNGVRYCINSASLRFIPYDEMETQGYGYLMDIFE